RGALLQQIGQQLAQEKARQMKAFEENMTDVVNHYLMAAIGNQIDLSDQLEYILTNLETNKQAIVEDIRMAHEAAPVHHSQAHPPQQPQSPPQPLALPSTVTGLTDVTRLQHEAETLDEYMRQAALRKGGDANKLPKIPVMLDDVATLNHLNLLRETDRQRLAVFLKQLQTSAPAVHMSFASEPSVEFTAK